MYMYTVTLTDYNFWDSKFNETRRFKACVYKGDDKPLKVIGNKYKTRQEANEACYAHYEKTKKMMENFGKKMPEAFFNFTE